MTQHDDVLRAVAGHECGHALTAALLVSPAVIKRIRINEDYSGFVEFNHQKISRNGHKIISAGGWAGESMLGLGTHSCASRDDRSYFDSIEQWHESLAYGPNETTARQRRFTLACGARRSVASYFPPIRQRVPARFVHRAAGRDSFACIWGLWLMRAHGGRAVVFPRPSGHLI
jgi:hypothetical protein